MSASQDSASRDHSRGSHRTNDSKKSSSSSDSKEPHTSHESYPPLHHPYHASSSHGRSHQLPSGLARSHSANSSSSGTSSSSSSADSAEHWPFSVRDIPDLDAVINAHLDELTKVLRHVGHHKDRLEDFADDKQDLLWQIFLARTGACPQRPGREETVAAQGREELIQCWRVAAANKHLAKKNLERAEHRLADFMSVLFKLLTERDRRRRVDRGTGH
ncbi:hypothetical protein CONLIGDRAFT_636121 [Coniochaeta ligniaria NRRL 30616]|uniref:Uncharacterized protein n=1 Tax=Coniochaeta ligniaria NRRL 30616 TaxID=1408157 RepID=A0A1J7IBE6_9PEZI|nr:hypothetical protein CONLIGDRAFT_636121 [Coniochaeta ligniaria NRRL 30616]